MNDADVAAALLGRGGRLQQHDFQGEADMFSDSDGGMSDGVDKCALVEALPFVSPFLFSSVWLGAIDLAHRQLACKNSYIGSGIS